MVWEVGVRGNQGVPSKARSRAGRRIWSDALTADAVVTAPRPLLAGMAVTEHRRDDTRTATAAHLEAEHAAAPTPVARVAATKMFVLNSETRRLHVFAEGASTSVCKYFTLDKHSAVPNPVLQGKAFRGRDVDPCKRCRRLANAQGLLQGGRSPALGGGTGSSSSEASSEASD